MSAAFLRAIAVSPWPTFPRAGDVFCAFCRKTPDRVALLIAAEDVAICDECIEVCQREVHQAHRRLAAEVSA